VVQIISFGSKPRKPGGNLIVLFSAEHFLKLIKKNMFSMQTMTNYRIMELSANY